MKSGQRYQLVSSAVAICGVALAVAVANHPVSQGLLTSMPVGTRLTPVVLSGTPFVRALAVTTVVMVAVCMPLFVRPRHAIDFVTLASRQVLVGFSLLSVIGYLDYTFRLPRTTFVLTCLLLCGLPVALVAINNRFLAAAERTIVIGNDPDRIARVLNEARKPISGYVSPPIRQTPEVEPQRVPVPVADGGAVSVHRDDPHRLGDLPELAEVLGEHDVGRAILAFSAPNRTDFFGALAVCHSHGVSVTADRECADSVLTKAEGSEFVEVDLEPWEWTDHICKSLFDKAFALCGLLALTPLVIGIAIAIELDDHGPILYSQERTTLFGRRFRLYKFRTMRPGSEDATPVDEGDNTQVTRVGRFLRRTHLDEIPQLYSILVGDMSVVGPRAVWTEEEAEFLDIQNGRWRQRWFVKPGLTGLAQINEVSSTNPELKLRYDIEYIRSQSFKRDLRIIARQIYMVLWELRAP